MQEAIRMPLRGSPSADRVNDTPESLTIELPSMWQWVKAGIGFTVGAGIATAVFAVPFMILWFLALGAWLVPFFRFR